MTTTVACGEQTISIRPFVRADAVGVAEFANALPEHDLLYLSRNIKHARVIEAWLDEVQAGRIESLVATKTVDEREVIVGMTAIVIDSLSWSPHVAEIRLLVSPGMRGNGLGRALLDANIPLARENGATKLMARMTPDQRNAIMLFEDSGFRGEALLRNHIRDRANQYHDLVILSLDLGRLDAAHIAYGLDAES